MRSSQGRILSKDNILDTSKIHIIFFNYKLKLLIFKNCNIRRNLIVLSETHEVHIEILTSLEVWRTNRKVLLYLEGKITWSIYYKSKLLLISILLDIYL